ncbi:MAG: Crp/Fnr family transcriptional regulator [Moorea sp. SIO2B7]|nr:Crp/Fnr family transcriptional regulator [Moorena sp. SIO2B7]
METKAFSEIFPLFSTANPETLEWLNSIVVEHEYPSNRTVLMEDCWGNAVYLIASGWVKVRCLDGEKAMTLAILGRGDFFGEMAILEESPRSTDVVALSKVKLISISAQRFIQMLFKDPKVHHRMLQLMVRRLRQFNIRFQLRNQPPAVKLAKTLVILAENYGKPIQEGKEIFRSPDQDLADIADIRLEETRKIIEKLESKGWVATDSSSQTLSLINLRQLKQLAGIM